MSNLIVSNLSDGTLSIPTTYVTNGSAKAWVNFNGTGTIAARDSFNTSSLTDNGTGNYTVNFSNSFLATDYKVTVSTSAVGSSSIISVTGAQTTSSIICLSFASAFTLTDSTTYCMDTHGDLA